MIAATLAFHGPKHPELTFAGLYLLFGITRLAAGCSAVARNELVAHRVPKEQRYALLSFRWLTGGIAGYAAASSSGSTI